MNEEQKPTRRMNLDLRRNVRQRAWRLANEAYTRYCAEIERALIEGELQAEQIEEWSPPQR